MKSRRQRIKEAEQELEEVRSKRAELGNPHSRELKNLEAPVKDALKYLKDENDTFEIVHAFDQIRNHMEEDSEDRDSLQESLGEEYTWEDAVEERREHGIETERLQGIEPSLKVTEVTRYIASLADEGELPEHLETPLSLLMDDFGRFTTQVANMSSASRSAEKEDSFLDNFDLDLDTDLDMEKMFYGLPPEETPPEEYKGVSFEPPIQPSKTLTEGVLEYMLDVYEEEVESRSEEVDLDADSEPRTVKKSYQTESKSINWNIFEQEFGTQPDEDLRNFYEAAVTYQDEDTEVTPDLLARLVADVNGADVEYESSEKHLADNFGSLKKAAIDVENFDYQLPVMDKRRELEQVASTIDRLEELYEKETYQIEREKAV